MSSRVELAVSLAITGVLMLVALSGWRAMPPKTVFVPIPIPCSDPSVGGGGGGPLVPQVR